MLPRRNSTLQELALTVLCEGVYVTNTGLMATYGGQFTLTFFSTTRQGYRQILAWMTSFGALKRIGVECTGTYGSGLLRYLQNAGLEVLEVTAPDRMERCKRGKSDTIDAECAAHAAFSGIRTVTPKTRNGMIESLRVLKTCEKQQYQSAERSPDYPFQ